MNLNDDEKLDLIQKSGFGIIQNQKWFSYGIDAVLLSNFANVKKGSTVVDLGTGTGIIPLLLSLKSKPEIIYGIEKQDEVVEMANRSIKHNGLDDLIKLKKIDIKDLSDIIKKSSVDVIVTNPPYFKKGGAIVNDKNIKAVSRHETTVDIEELIKKSAEILKNKGEFYMVHRPMRLVDIFYYSRKYNLEPKEIQFIHPNSKKASNIVLIKCVKDGNSELKHLNNIYVYNDDGSYTDDIFEIYKSLKIDVFLEENSYGKR